MILLVHETKPAFLTGKRKLLSKQKGPVLPLKDPTSDMAVIARQGSVLVREMRDKKEKNKFRQRFWEVAGSKMGKITGLTKTEVKEAEKAKQQELEDMGLTTENADDDFRASSQFKKHMKSEGLGDENFWEKIQKQRRSLPVYSVREDLMQVNIAVLSPQASHCGWMSSGDPREPGGRRYRRDRFRKDDADDTVSDRRGIRKTWYDWLYTAATCGCHERGQTCQ